MLWKRFRKTVSPDTILKQYRKLKRTRGPRHSIEYDRLKVMVQNNQDQLYELVFSGKITDWRVLNELILFGGHGGSCKKQYNLHWIPFMSRVNERVHELPIEVQASFQWYGEIHHYWDEE